MTPEELQAVFDSLNWTCPRFPKRCRCGATFKPYGTYIACGTCRHNGCSHSHILEGHGHIVLRSEAHAPKSLCLSCGMLIPRPKGSGPGMYLFRDHRRESPPVPCAHCGRTNGTEDHHWAPRAIFADADDWPISPLCQPCHQLWHYAMRVAAGHRMPEDKRFGHIEICDTSEGTRR